jgi:VanZ family protein
MRIHRKLVWTSALVVFLVITLLSLSPPESGIEIPGNDKVGHFLAYFAFSFNLCLLARRNVHLVWIFPMIIGYGILIEFLQGLIPGRMPSGLDVLANSTGVLVGSTLYFLVNKLGWLQVV